MENCCNTPEDASEAILAFDTLFTTNHMKILKLLFPYLNNEEQKKLAIYIKWQELTYTLSFFNHSSNLCPSCTRSKKDMDFSVLYPILSSYCSQEEKEFLSKISGFMNMKSMIVQMQEYLPLIQGLLSSNGTNQNGFTLDSIKNILSEEQAAIFSMFMEKVSDT